MCIPSFLPCLAQSAWVVILLCQLLPACDPGAPDTDDARSDGGAASSGALGLLPPGGEPVNATGGCTPGTISGSGQLLGPFGATRVKAGGRQYFLQVNEWNSTAAQTIEYGGSFFFQVARQEASASTQGGPTGYPSMFIGANSGHATLQSNLPKQVSTLTTVPTTWNWNANGATDEATNSYNVAYDVWFSTQPEGEPNEYAPSGAFLMVWLHKPSDAQPLGMVQYPDVTIAGVAGTWDVWVGGNNGIPCISYVSKPSTHSLSFDLNVFIQDAVNNRPGTLQSSWYLTNVFAGFEIWRGGVGLETTSFCAVVN
ncbi:MAG: hypothetical protein JW940_15930 [Polyangiaceae bacterium]|nr:hypothetical protein [Polyangiaceae bacterium]